MSSKPLHFVVGSALLVGAPLSVGCEKVEPPNVNTVAPVEHPPVEAPPEGVGVPLPRSSMENQPEEPSEVVEGPRVNPGPEEAPPAEPPPEEPPSPMRTNSGPFRRAPVE